jgi:hypothetical protein
VLNAPKRVVPWQAEAFKILNAEIILSRGITLLRG